MKHLTLVLTTSLLATACATRSPGNVPASPTQAEQASQPAAATPQTPVTTTAPSVPNLDAAATVVNWQAQQLPRIQALADSSAKLRDSVASLCQRLSADQLDQARSAWKSSYAAWRAVEALPMGPTLTRRTAWQIDVWPSRSFKVEEAVRLVEKDAPIADSVGAAAQGLPALEFLLWGDDRAKAQLGRLHFRQRCQYSAALARDVATESAGLLADWQSFSRQQYDTETGRQAFEEAVNLIAGTMQNLRDKKVARLGGSKAVKQVARQEFDAWRSRQTKAGLAATVGALESLFLAPGENNSPSFVDRLAAAGKPLLAQHLRDEIRTAREALAKMPDDVAQAASRNPAVAKPFVDSIKRLQGLVELQVADAVGITIGFKDSDGD
ncbi:imelysin family protein [Chitinimonas sp. PSY-7]|uniref:imelysin family protein n=1 Tax=Chitinimonas sp. PSY-7 TaxID=3459088 RepID=UPI0040400ACE